MEKRQKKILLLSIFGGAAICLAVGWFAFIIWIITKAFPDLTGKEVAKNFIELIECQSRSGRSDADPECVKKFSAGIRKLPTEEKLLDNPEYNQCVYEQEIILEALSASKSHGEDLLNERISGYCSFAAANAEDSVSQENYTLLKNIKNQLASHAILNYRYSFFKKKNYTVELQALEPYVQFASQEKTCQELEKDLLDLNSRGSVFALGTIAVCKLQACVEDQQKTCPASLTFAQRMKSAGDIGADYIYMHEAALDNKDNEKAVNFARKALLNGYTDLLATYPALEDDFFKIKFSSEGLIFSAARLANTQKVYTPALNCVAASLNKDQEFETFLKSPQTYSMSTWADKITAWATDDTELLLRVACEVLTDVESKKRIHNYYMNDGNEDGSAFDFCQTIHDPLFNKVCNYE